MLDGQVESYIQLHRDIIGDVMLYPDLTLVLDLEPAEGLERIRRAGRQLDWFSKLQTLQEVRQNYLDLAERTDLGPIHIINAMRSSNEVLQEAVVEIKKLFLK